LGSRDPLEDLAAPAQKAFRQAEKLFLHGKFLIQEGKPDEARRAFDEAVDTLLSIPADAAGREGLERRIEELIRRIHRYDLEDLGAGFAPELQQFPPSPIDEILNPTFPVDPSLAPRRLPRIEPGVSQLPLVVNDAVRSYIGYFTSPRGSRILLNGLRRSGRYRQMIYRILDEEGVPRELIHLAQAESAFQPRAVSRARATGMWQFVRSRGREYGLEASRQADERMDPEKATRAAARHLRDLYQQMGDWHLAMAAYNCGPLCVERAVQRTGYADFWELRARNALPRETMNYVPAILAIAIIAQNPQLYGLPAVDFDDPLEYDTVRLTAETSLALIADAADAALADIRELNPSLLGRTAPAGAEVRVPRGSGQAVLAALDLVPPERRTAWRLHRVAGGDTLASIARRYQSSSALIGSANEASGAGLRLEEGALLVIPVAAPSPQKERRAAASRAKPSPSRTAARRQPASGVRIASAAPRRPVRR
ncbi:MAG: transglycosylase SLT domain-containing protein, partial [Bryobacteraceae bacterium]|nr:transglycosylase SLT domain-containing protein [Bryobacteraceae bacterium]